MENKQKNKTKQNNNNKRTKKNITHTLQNLLNPLEILSSFLLKAADEIYAN